VDDGARLCLDLADGACELLVKWGPADKKATLGVRQLADLMRTNVWGDGLTRSDIDMTELGSSGALTMHVEELPR
jgi:hypothetical protein